MDPVLFAATFLLGLVIGAAGGWPFARALSVRLAADTAALQARLEETAKRTATLEGALAESQREFSTHRVQAARVAAELEGERKAELERKALLAQTDERLRESFAAVSADVLRTNSQSFLELAKASLGEFQKQATTDLERRQETIGNLVEPVHESLARVDAKLHEVEKERANSHTRLVEQLRSLGTVTTNLDRALRTPNVRGGWGEV